MTPLEIEIIAALNDTDEYLSIPALVHHMQNKDFKNFKQLSLVCKGLEQQGLLKRMRRPGRNDSNANVTVYQLSQAMRESLARVVARGRS